MLVCETNFLARTMPGDNHLVNPSFKLLAVVFFAEVCRVCLVTPVSQSDASAVISAPVSSVFF